MKKKLMIALLVLTMGLVACGSTETPDREDADGKSSKATENEDTSKANTDTKEEKDHLDNVIALLGRKDEQARSAVITFDADKIQICDEDSGNSSFADFELIGDSGSILEMSCETASVQELYDETMEGYGGEEFSVTQMRDASVGDIKYKAFEVLLNGEVEDYYFIIELENGLCLYNGRSNGYDGNADFEEMLGYVFVSLEEGDGTKIRPTHDYTAETDGNVLTVQFASGEQFELDYDETVTDMNVSTSGSVLYFEYLDENYYDLFDVQAYITNNYGSIEEYAQAEKWDPNAAFEQININGTDISISTNEWKDQGLFFIPMKDGYAIRGEFYAYDYENPASIQNVLALLLGGEVGDFVISDNTQPSSQAPVPTQWSSDYIQIDGVEYQFPMLVSDLTANGWTLTEDSDKVAIHQGLSFATMVKDEKAIIVNITSTSDTDDMPIEQGEVVRLTITATSGVSAVFPGGLTYNSTKDDVEAVITDSFSYNSSSKCFYNDADYYSEVEPCLLYINMSSDENRIEEVKYMYGR